MAVNIGHINEVDASTTILSSASHAGDLSISNVADPIMGRRHRLSVLTDWGQADFGSDKTIDIVCLAFARDTTSPTAGTVQHQFDADGGTAGTGAAHDSTAISIGTVDGYDYHVYKPSSPVTARYWRWTFAATGVTFIDTVRAWAGTVFEPTYDIAFGYQDMWADISRTSIAARSGTQYVDERARRRSISFSLGALSAAERTTLRDMQRTVGISKQVLTVIDPATPARETLIGRLGGTAPMVRALLSADPLYSQQFTISESL
jgi:hypothetical protein